MKFPLPVKAGFAALIGGVVGYAYHMLMSLLETG